MDQKLKDAFEIEMAKAFWHLEQGALALAFFHAELAHILGQKYVMLHVRTHWLMLRVGLARRATRDVAGQIARIMLGAIGSAIGLVPVGNAGGSNISMFQRLPVDPTLSEIINAD
ncbi:DUF3703 domain-containing protein [Janthinobacterium sp. 17J80-10]|uniref:DUF3703 domain-containing protein n=1 Tax=Janthinobacterium sp. 17J80-10 TaxID=2497863 RepID=UPI0013E8CCE1|nr:DUF3703 domain-containing protein [Janthinobacterium sp. 17J80-10]